MAISMGASVPEPLLPAVELPWPAAAPDAADQQLSSVFWLPSPASVPLPLPDAASGLTAAGEAGEAGAGPAPAQKLADQAERWLNTAHAQGQLSVWALPVVQPAAIEPGNAGAAAPWVPLLAPPLAAPTDGTAAIRATAAEPTKAQSGTGRSESFTRAPTQLASGSTPIADLPEQGTPPPRASMAPVAETPLATAGITSPSAPPSTPNVPMLASIPAVNVQPPAPAQALQARWGERMVQALQDSVQLQLQQKVQHATIRLDPPHLGHLEVSVSHEAGRVEVHLQASTTEVARLLGNTCERLRLELTDHNFVQVNVSVSADAQGRHAPRQPAQPQPGLLADNDAALAEDAPAQRERTVSDVLVTV